MHAAGLVTGHTRLKTAETSSLPESQALGVSYFARHARRRRRLGRLAVLGQLLHGVYELAQVPDVLRVRLQVAVATAFDPQRLVLLLGKLPQALAVTEVHDVIGCALPYGYTVHKVNQDSTNSRNYLGGGNSESDNF